jgi:hypothetical protein
MKKVMRIFLCISLLQALVPLCATEVSTQISVEIQQKEKRYRGVKPVVAALIGLAGMSVGAVGMYYALMKKCWHVNSNAPTTPPPPPMPSAGYKAQKLPTVINGQMGQKKEDDKGDSLYHGTEGNPPLPGVTQDDISNAAARLKKTEQRKEDSVERVDELKAKMLQSELNRNNAFPNGEPEKKV